MPGLDPARDLDGMRVRELVRRVLRSGGTDLDAVEELVFVQELDDPLGFTEATDPAVERSILHEAFDVELAEYIAEILADNRLTAAEVVQLRSSLSAASGRLFDPDVALAPYEAVLAAARGDHKER